MNRSENKLRAPSGNNCGHDFSLKLGSKPSTNITRGPAGTISNCIANKIKKVRVGRCKLRKPLCPPLIEGRIFKKHRRVLLAQVV